MNGTFDGVEVQEPSVCENMAVFPLRRLRAEGERATRREYLLAAEAIGEGRVQVVEVDADGSVSHLLVKNRAGQAVLFVEGEELIGAKQNRVLNTSVLVGSDTECVIPVSCIEQGRWNELSRSLDSAGRVSPSHLRHKLKRSVTRSLRRKRGHRSDQTEVWQDIHVQQRDMKVDSKTVAMTDTFERYKKRIERIRAALPWRAGTEGLVVAVDGRIVGMDLFDSNEVCAEAWDRLLAGYALDALRAELKRAISGERELVGVQSSVERSTRRDQQEAVPQRSEIEMFLERLDQSEWEEASAVGEGREFRLELGPHQQASILHWHGRSLHSSATVEAAG